MDADSADDEISIELRDAAAAAARALILASALARLALEDAAIPSAEAETEAFDLREWLREERLASAATPSERSMLQRAAGGVSAEERSNFAWQGEALAMLSWALSLSAELPPGVPTDLTELLRMFPAPWERTASWIEQARLRPEPEIAAARERAEVWHWRANVEALRRTSNPANGRDYEDAIRDVFAESVSAGLVVSSMAADFSVAGRPVRSLTEHELGSLIAGSAERLRALNWLCGFGDSWDDVPLEV